jgi:methionyl-tRNA synthetase
MRLATEVNRYLDTHAPWQLVKQDKDAAARIVYTALTAINYLKILFSPVLPFTSEKLHKILGYETQLFGTQIIESISDELGEHEVNRYDPTLASGKWEPTMLPAGQKFGAIAPLFKKLDVEIVEQERSRLGKKH